MPTQAPTSALPVSESPVEPLPKSKRLFLLAHLLREGERTLRDIAVHLYPTASIGGNGWAGIERSIQRDLNDLEYLEPDFLKLSGRPPRYRITTHRSTLHPTENLALLAAARLTYHRAAGEQRHHQEALKKLLQWLPDNLRGVMARSFTDLGEKRYTFQNRESQNLEHTAAAWMDGHPLSFEYQKPGGSGAWRTNIVQTYIIETHPQNLDLYLIGKEISFHNDVRTFKLSRMRNLQVLRDSHYLIPDTFNPSEFFHAAWGVVGAQGQPVQTIHLRFRQDAAYRIMEGGYAHMTEPVINCDGSIETTIEAPVDGSGLPREVLPWIYSFGPRVEVLEPAHIRVHWLNELRAALEKAQQNSLNGESA